MGVEERQTLRQALYLRPELGPDLGGSLVPRQALLVDPHERATLAIEGLLQGLSPLSNAGKQRPLPYRLRQRLRTIQALQVV